MSESGLSLRDALISRISAAFDVEDDNASEPYSSSNLSENDPRRCYVLGEPDACVR